MGEKDIFSDGKGHSIKNMGEGYCTRPDVIEMAIFIKSILARGAGTDGNRA